MAPKYTYVHLSVACCLSEAHRLTTSTKNITSQRCQNLHTDVYVYFSFPNPGYSDLLDRDCMAVFICKEITCTRFDRKGTNSENLVIPQLSVQSNISLEKRDQRPTFPQSPWRFTLLSQRSFKNACLQHRTLRFVNGTIVEQLQALSVSLRHRWLPRCFFRGSKKDRSPSVPKPHTAQPTATLWRQSGWKCLEHPLYIGHTWLGPLEKLSQILHTRQYTTTHHQSLPWSKCTQTTLPTLRSILILSYHPVAWLDFWRPKNRSQWQSLAVITKLNQIMRIYLITTNFSTYFIYCVCSFGYFPGVKLCFADVSEPSVRSIFKGWMWNPHPAGEIPKRIYTIFRTRRKFEIKNTFIYLNSLKICREQKIIPRPQFKIFFLPRLGLCCYGRPLHSPHRRYSRATHISNL
jgi:hypothetical protein